MTQAPHKQYKTVLWDWNGTLFNDVALCFELVNALLMEHEHKPLADFSHYRDVFCFPIEAYYQKAGFDFAKEPFADLATTYIARYNARWATCGLQPHIEQVLADLQQSGVRLAILSASKRDSLLEQVEHFGITHFFTDITGIDDIFAASKRSVGKAWLAQSDVDPATTVMIGDSVHDYDVACAMGIDCILYAGGHQSTQALAQTGVPVIDDFRLLQNYCHTNK